MIPAWCGRIRVSTGFFTAKRKWGYDGENKKNLYQTWSTVRHFSGGCYPVIQPGNSDQLRNSPGVPVSGSGFSAADQQTSWPAVSMEMVFCRRAPWLNCEFHVAKAITNQNHPPNQSIWMVYDCFRCIQTWFLFDLGDPTWHERFFWSLRNKDLPGFWMSTGIPKTGFQRWLSCSKNSRIIPIVRRFTKTNRWVLDGFGEKCLFWLVVWLPWILFSH